MRLLFGLMLFLITSISVQAQHKIDFTIDNYEQDTVIVGYYLVDKQLVHDTILRDDKNQFVLEGDHNLDPGVYLLLLLPEKEFIQFLVSEREQFFSLQLDRSDLSSIQTKNTADNQTFQDYVSFLKVIRPTADVLRDTIKALTTAEKDATEFQEQLLRMDSVVYAYQDSLINNHPELISTMMIKANKEVILPDFSHTEDPALERYMYYRDHYFDNIDLTNPAVARTPFLHQRVDYFLNKLTPNHPDSLSKALDWLFAKMPPKSETFKYYVSHYLNHYAVSKIVGFDEIFVHLVDNYYAKGKAFWADEENVTEIISKANQIRPTLIGKIGADLTVFDKDENPITLSEIDYEYLVLLFWAPDCGHCKKKMPEFVEFDKKWSPKGVKTLAICTKLMDKVGSCWDAIDSKDMGGFINAADKYHESNYKVKYNVTSTPKVFILDQKREILIKNIGAEHLETVMDEIIKIKAQEEGN